MVGECHFEGDAEYWKRKWKRKREWLKWCEAVKYNISTQTESEEKYIIYENSDTVMSDRPSMRSSLILTQTCSSYAATEH